MLRTNPPPTLRRRRTTNDSHHSHHKLYNVKNLPSDIIPISIAGKAPDWWRGLEYKGLAPKWSFFSVWKETRDNDITSSIFRKSETKKINQERNKRMEIKNMNLHQKLLKIADMAGALQRTKAAYGYKYVPEEDIQAKVTAGMQKYGVMLYHSIVPGTLNVLPYTYTKYDKTLKGDKTCNEVIVSADTRYTWVNVDNPEEHIENTWVFVGQMEDAAQAFGAAETYANRYYLMKSLQLATTESDPDNYRSKQKQAEDFEENKAAKEAEDRLKKAIKSVVDAGTELIKGGMDKTKMREIVAKFNNGNGNPSSIESEAICEQILKELDEISKNATEKK